MTTPTLFLDFDGPLFPDRWIRVHSGQHDAYPGNVKMPDDVTYHVMDPMSVEMLNNAFDVFPFQTVVSSSWRKFINKEQCEDLFMVNRLRLKLADDWKTIHFSRDGYSRMSARECQRAMEIREYVKRNEIEKYIVLDDPMSGSSLNDKNHELDENRIILVDQDVGLSSMDYRLVIDLALDMAGKPPQPTFFWR